MEEKTFCHECNIELTNLSWFKGENIVCERCWNAEEVTITAKDIGSIEEIL